MATKETKTLEFQEAESPIEQPYQSTKMENPTFWRHQVLSLQEYAHRIANENIYVVLHIGNPMAPNNMEVKLDAVATELKTHFKEN